MISAEGRCNYPDVDQAVVGTVGTDEGQRVVILCSVTGNAIEGSGVGEGCCCVAAWICERYAAHHCPLCLLVEVR
jgi:ribose 5-phosphate isomerase RpiB